MATNENLIPIPGRLHSVASDEIVSGADEIYDDKLLDNLENLNTGFTNDIDTIYNTIGDNNEKGAIMEQLNTIDGRLDTIDGEISALNSVPIEVVPLNSASTAPNVNNPKENTLYRAYNSNNTLYSDWMYQDGSWVMITQLLEPTSLEKLVGYYTCNTAANTPGKEVTTGNSGYILPANGGAMKIKMINANTANKVTLKIGTETAKTLLYNGEAVSASNTWEANEVISVYFDGTNYQASNSMGGGSAIGKKKLTGSTGYVSLAGTVAPNPTTSGSGVTAYKYIQYPVKEGDVVEIRGIGNSNAWTWGLIDSERNIIKSSGGATNYTSVPFRMIIPSGVDYIIINNYNTTYPNYEWYFAKKGSIGAHEMLTEPYLYGDLRTLAVGQTYEKDEAVKTTDKQFRRITKSIKTLSLSETLISGDIKVNSSKTYRAASAINTFNPSTSYSAGAYVLGSMTVYTLTVTAESVTAGNITVNGTDVAIEGTDDAAAIASKIASALVIDGWTDSASENVVTVRCNTIGNNTTTITITDTDNTGVAVASSSVAGTSVIRKYDGETWTNASVSEMVTDGVLIEVDVAWLIANATMQNSVVRDISLDKELYSVPYLNVFSGYNSVLTASKTSNTISIYVSRQSTDVNAIAGFIIPPYIAGKKIGLKFSFSKTSDNNTNTPLYFFGAASTYTRLGVICTLSGNNGFVDEIVNVPENTAYIGIIANGINRYSTLTFSNLVIYERDEQKTLAQKTEDNSDTLNNLLGTNYFDLEKAVIYGSNPSIGTIVKIEDGIKITCVSASNQILWWQFPKNLKMGAEYIISFDATIKGGTLGGSAKHNFDIYNDATYVNQFIISKSGHYEKKIKINGSLYRFRVNSAYLIGRAGVSIEFTNISFKVPSININKIEDIAEEVGVLDNRLVACESSCKDKDTYFFEVEEDGLYFVDKYLNIGGKFDGNGFHAININE